VSRPRIAANEQIGLLEHRHQFCPPKFAGKVHDRSFLTPQVVRRRDGGGDYTVGGVSNQNDYRLAGLYEPVDEC
jgi:hypothetical protein